MDAQSSALQAVIYNRLGDVGLVVVIFIRVSNCGCWGFSDLF